MLETKHETESKGARNMKANNGHNAYIMLPWKKIQAILRGELPQ